VPFQNTLGNFSQVLYKAPAMYVCVCVCVFLCVYMFNGSWHSYGIIMQVCRRRCLSPAWPDHVPEEEALVSHVSFSGNIRQSRELDRVSRGIKQTICFAEWMNEWMYRIFVQDQIFLHCHFRKKWYCILFFA
jgi:hypothetical protein